MSQWDNDHIIRTISFAISVVSLGATLFLIYVFSRFRHIRQNFSFRMIFYLSLSDFIWETVHIISFIRLSGFDDQYNILCRVEGSLTSFSRLSILCWTTAIAFTVYQNQVQNIQVAYLTSKEWKYQLFCVGIPVIGTVM